ncbi:hypothetical protein, partial [Staphylococcus aureus]
MALRVLADLLVDDEGSAPAIASTQRAVADLLTADASADDAEAQVDVKAGPPPSLVSEYADRSGRTAQLLT